ncbi:18288_t:CDS:1, partial [Acaulospora morrowiae]
SLLNEPKISALPVKSNVAVISEEIFILTLEKEYREFTGFVNIYLQSVQQLCAPLFERNGSENVYLGCRNERYFPAKYCTGMRCRTDMTYTSVGWSTS